MYAPKYAKYGQRCQTWYLWCIFGRAKYGQVGCPWKDLAKCSSYADASVWKALRPVLCSPKALQTITTKTISLTKGSTKLPIKKRIHHIHRQFKNKCLDMSWHLVVELTISVSELVHADLNEQFAGEEKLDEQATPLPRWHNCQHLVRPFVT